MASEQESVSGSVDGGGLSIRIATGISAFAKSEWDQLSGTSRNESGTPYNPFVSFDFLSILEESGCAVRGTGWQAPSPAAGSCGRHGCSAPSPAIAKSHSQGEYVFDHGWADAFERAGGQLLSEAAGRGALHAGDRPAPAGQPRRRQRRRRRRRWPTGLKSVTDAARRVVGPCHLRRRTATCAALEAAGFLHRTDQQFHFFNEGYLDLRRLPRHAGLAQAQGAEEGAPRGAGRRHHDRPADRRGPDRSASGTPSSRSTWTPAAANGAGPISTATSSR